MLRRLSDRHALAIGAKMKIQSSFLSHLALLGALLAPAAASATDVVVPPLLAKGANAKTAANITSLILSELDFNPNVDSVKPMAQRPGSLNSACLGSASCLRGIASSGGGDAVIAGTLIYNGSAYSLDGVFFDGGKIVRRKTFALGEGPEQIADGMTAVLKELITGVGPKAAKAAEPTVDDFSFDDDDDDDFDFDDSDFDAAAEEEAARKAEAKRAEEAARKRAEEEARRRAEEEARRRAEEEARRRAEEEARRRAAEEARKQREAEARAEEARRRRAEEEASREEDEFDPSAITFGGSATVLETDDAPEERRDYMVDDDSFDLADDDDDDEPSFDLSGDDDIIDLDEEEDEKPARKPRREKTPKPEVLDDERPKRTRDNSSSTSSDDRPVVALRARGGVAPYYALTFITYGGEVAVPVVSGLEIVAGVEGWSVKREIPPRFREDGGPVTEWNSIFPFHAGALYKLYLGKAQPYFGADFIGAQYYVDPSTGQSYWALGGRARIGIDFMFTQRVGLNLDAGVGYWGGTNWEIIQRDMKNAGVIPRLGAGLTFAF